MKKPTYNHAFTLAFSVSHSTDENGEDVTPEMLKKALLQRIKDLEESPYKNEWLEATGAPFDTYEEDEEHWKEE